MTFSEAAKHALSPDDGKMDPDARVSQLGQKK